MIFILFSVLDLCTCKRLMVEAFNSKIISTISAKNTVIQSFELRVSNVDLPQPMLLNNKISHGRRKTPTITDHQVWSLVVATRMVMQLMDKKNRQKDLQKSHIWDKPPHHGKIRHLQKHLLEAIPRQSLHPDPLLEALLLWNCLTVVYPLQSYSQNSHLGVQLLCHPKVLNF